MNRARNTMLPNVDRARGNRATNVVRALLLALATVASLLLPAQMAQAAPSGTQVVGLAGKCLTANGPSANGTRLVLSTCRRSAQQLWTTPGARSVRAMGRCMDAAPVAGAVIRLWACTGGPHQQWQLAAGRLALAGTALCVEVARAGTADGSATRLNSCNGRAHQTWSRGATTVVAAAARRRDFFDDFTAPLNTAVWGRYGFGRQAPGNGAMGLYDVGNVYTDAGKLTLRTRYVRGQGWTSAGVSSARGFSAGYGEWQIRARFDRAQGVGYAFLLYPNDGSWPPEVDIAEGKVNGPSVMSTLHWGPTNQQSQRWNTVPDMRVWHTYGVIMAPGRLTYTLDGVAWASFATPNVPAEPMWVGLQTGAHSCPSQFECVAGNTPNRHTPISSTIQVDWIAHYAN